MNLKETFLDRVRPQDREIARRAGLAWELIDALKTALPGRLPNQRLTAMVQETQRVMNIPRGSNDRLYPRTTGPIFTDPEGNRWNLNASNEGFYLIRWRPLPSTSPEPEVHDNEFVSAQTRPSDPVFGTAYESWISHYDKKGRPIEEDSPNMQASSNDETTASKGKEFIGRFVAALRAVPAEAEI